MSIVCASVACASAVGTETTDGRPADSSDAAQFADANNLVDANMADANSTLVDASDLDASLTSDLDPNLALPDPGGMVCNNPGSLGDCPSTQVCRFFDSESGRCESCTDCGNLNAFCSASEECDILFNCYLGRCTSFCTLGSFECGPVDDCADIGHPTKGACVPF